VLHFLLVLLFILILKTKSQATKEEEEEDEDDKQTANSDTVSSSEGVLYGPLSSSGNWSYSLVANASTPFAEGAAYEATWVLPACETGASGCVDLTSVGEGGDGDGNDDDGQGNGTTSKVVMCCGLNCLDTSLFRHATDWTASDDPSDLSSDDPVVGQLALYGFCSDDAESWATVTAVERLRVEMVRLGLLWLVWWWGVVGYMGG